MKLKLPTRTEFFLLVMIVLSLFFLDINQNKLITHGIDYVTTWFGGIETKAITNFWVGIFVYFILFVLLSVYTLIERDRMKEIPDIVISMFAVFGLAFLVGGFLTGLYDVDVPFFNLFLTATEFYHIGITLSVISAISLTIID